MEQMTWEEFLKRAETRIYSLYKKKEYTPYELKECFEDETTTEYVADVKIVQAVTLPDKEIMIVTRAVWMEDVRDENNCLIQWELKESEIINYFRFNEITLSDITDIETYSWRSDDTDN